MLFGCNHHLVLARNVRIHQPRSHPRDLQCSLQGNPQVPPLLPNPIRHARGRHFIIHLFLTLPRHLFLGRRRRRRCCCCCCCCCRHHYPTGSCQIVSDTWLGHQGRYPQRILGDCTLHAFHHAFQHRPQAPSPGIPGWKDHCKGTGERLLVSQPVDAGAQPFPPLVLAVLLLLLLLLWPRSDHCFDQPPSQSEFRRALQQREEVLDPAVVSEDHARLSPQRLGVLPHGRDFELWDQALRDVGRPDAAALVHPGDLDGLVGGNGDGRHGRRAAPVVLHSQRLCAHLADADHVLCVGKHNHRASVKGQPLDLLLLAGKRGLSLCHHLSGLFLCHFEGNLVIAVPAIRSNGVERKGHVSLELEPDLFHCAQVDPRVHVGEPRLCLNWRPQRDRPGRPLVPLEQLFHAQLGLQYSQLVVLGRLGPRIRSRPRPRPRHRGSR